PSNAISRWSFARTRPSAAPRWPSSTLRSSTRLLPRSPALHVLKLREKRSPRGLLFHALAVAVTSAVEPFGRIAVAGRRSAGDTQRGVRIGSSLPLEEEQPLRVGC